DPPGRGRFRRSWSDPAFRSQRSSDQAARMADSAQAVLGLSRIKLRQCFRQPTHRRSRDPTMLKRLLVLSLALVVSACASTPMPVREAAERPLVVLVSIDGFRADYLDRGITPN